MSDIAAAGSPEEDPCIDSSDAIMLVDLLKDFGIGSGCLNMYREECKQPNFNIWSVPHSSSTTQILCIFQSCFMTERKCCPRINGALLFHKHTLVMKHRPAAPSESLLLKRMRL